MHRERRSFAANPRGSGILDPVERAAQECLTAIERGDVDAATACGPLGAPGVVAALAAATVRVVEDALRVVARGSFDDGLLDAVLGARERAGAFGPWAAALVGLCRAGERARTVVHGVLADPTEPERVLVVRALADADLDFAAPEVARLLRDGAMEAPAALAGWACRYLLAVDPEGAEAVAALLDHPDLRDVAATELAAVRDRRALEPLLERLRGGDHAVTAALGRLGDASSVPALCDELVRERASRSAEQFWQARTAAALEAIGDPAALPALYGVRIPVPRHRYPGENDGEDIRHDAAVAIASAIATLEGVSRRPVR